MEQINSILFSGLSAQELSVLENFGNIYRRVFDKGAAILRTGDKAEVIGVVMSGAVHIEAMDPWGNKSILGSVGAGEIFAESYALCGTAMMVDAVAAQRCEILFLKAECLTSEQYSAFAWQKKLTENLLIITSRKNLALSQRIFCTAPKTIRARLITYLSTLSACSGGGAINIPFNRQQLADYLNVERSALSKELGKMRNDGLLEFRKNRFILKHRV